MHLTTMCLQNLLRRRLRTSLCILGIALATMFIVAIGATTMNYVSAIKEMNMFFNGEVVVVSRGVFVIYAFPIGGSLPESILDEVRRIEGVNMVVPMLFVISHNSQDALQLVPETIVLGIPAGEWRVLVGSTPLEPGGRWPSTDHGTMEVVLGPSLAHERNLTVGSRIEAKSHHLMVTGVLETRSVFLSRSIIMPLTVAQKVYRYNMLVNMIVVKPVDGTSQKELASAIEMQLGNIKALTSEERNRMVEPVLRDLDLWSLGIRSVLFFLSMILVAVVAMMSVSERRRDFATLEAIGAPRSFIFRMVITETGLLGFVGGIIGMLLGTPMALFVTSFYTNIPIQFFFQNPFGTVSPLFLVEILASTVVIGCAAGLIPAIAAAKSSVGEVLRCEY